MEQTHGGHRRGPSMFREFGRVESTGGGVVGRSRDRRGADPADPRVPAQLHRSVRAEQAARLPGRTRAADLRGRRLRRGRAPCPGGLVHRRCGQPERPVLGAGRRPRRGRHHRARPAALPERALVGKRLVADLTACPTLGVTTPGTQVNPLMDNYEALAIDPRGSIAARRSSTCSATTTSAPPR
ncbi:hypothetical protein FRAHR75_200033 [Frankia sp. Hr75.2]|nr:hypothetical protein FRAHR75_200033 [Frankia sp. Hr75.2]